MSCSRASVDVTATVTGSGQREAEVILDEGAYVEMRFWHDPRATPAQVAALNTSALTAATGGQRG